LEIVSAEMPLPPRIAVVVLNSLIALLLAAPSAGAFAVDIAVDPQAGSGALPRSGPTAAGAHPDLVTTLTFSDRGNPRADTVAGYVIDFAPGIVAYVNHVGECSRAQFAQGDTSRAPSCPSDSAVGDVVTEVTLDAVAPVTQRLNGTIYNLEPPSGSPGAFGIDIASPVGPRVKLLAIVSVDPADLGLRATLTGLPDEGELVAGIGVPLHTDSITQRLYGYVGSDSFFTNPTSCIAAPIAVSATSHASARSSAGDSYTPTDCANVPFSTTLAIAVDPPISDWTSTVTSNVKPGESDVPRVNSHVKSTTVVLPESLLLNPALAARLDACTDAQFALANTAVEARCPPSSAVGDISFVSPILGAFPGKAYFGTSTPQDRLRLFLDVPLFGAHIKVSARVRPSRTTGQITTIFDLLPQVAFTDFTLTFHGGPRSALVSPTQCGSHTASVLTTPWSGTPPVSSSASFSISFDGRGAACQRLFAPSMGTAVSDRRSGASPTFTLTATRPDRHVPIGRMTYRLPAGLVANHALDGLAECSLSAAAAARCPASSRIGSVTAIAGSGTEPPTLPGSIYLTKPKVAGDPAGISVQVPAQLGPVDAGIVIVGARIQLLSDGGLLVTSDPIPALQEGIPLALRRLTVRVGRRGFMRNPSSCGEKTALGHFDALGGGGADVSSTLTLVGCDRLGFAPRIRAFLGARGRTRVGAHPPFVTAVTAAGDDAAIARARVRLPKALATNVRALNAACAQEELDAGTCSKRARIGTARAVSPLFEEPVTGPVFLVKRDQGLPKVTVQLRTPIALQFDGIVTVGRGGRIATTFDPVPDLPVTRFVLKFRGGPYGPLAATRNLCRAKLRLPASFRAHNGKAVSQRPRIAIRGCPKR
jgi:hypothetical protein